MIVVIAKGIGYGLILAMLIGPVFFALIRTSITKGFRSGAYLALGIALSDAIAAATVYMGISRFLENDFFKSSLAFAGGWLMIIFGLLPFIRSASKKKFIPSKNIYQSEGTRFILEGLLLNLLNPLVYVTWVVIISFAVGQGFGNNERILFFVSVILTVFSADLVKVYVADRITSYLTVRIISIIDRIAGFGLIAFGIRLFYFAIYGV